MHRHEELTGVFDWERNVFQDADPEQRTIIGTLESGQVVKGRARRGALECGLTYRFLGNWTTHPTWGKQFLFSSFTPAMPAGERATVRYLAKGPSIGRARAQRIWNLYGEQALEVVRTDPDRVASDVDGLTAERAESAAEYFRAHVRLEKVTIEVNDLLGNRGFPRTLPDKVIREWGEDAPRVIRETPYRLMAFSGVGFGRADALYMELGHDPAAIERQGYSIHHALTRDGDGHTWYPLRFASLALRRTVSNGAARLDAALAWAREHGLLAPPAAGLGGSSAMEHVAEAEKANAETRLAEYVGRMEREGMVQRPRWPELESEDQI